MTWEQQTQQPFSFTAIAHHRSYTTILVLSFALPRPKTVGCRLVSTPNRPSIQQTDPDLHQDQASRAVISSWLFVFVLLLLFAPAQSIVANSTPFELSLSLTMRASNLLALAGCAATAVAVLPGAGGGGADLTYNEFSVEVQSTLQPESEASGASTLLPTDSAASLSTMPTSHSGSSDAAAASSSQSTSAHTSSANSTSGATTRTCLPVPNLFF